MRQRRVLQLGVPVLGICYGMQYIAKVFGGAIASAPIASTGTRQSALGSTRCFKG
ncbi:MAG: gamma-glutamyl-gamma-aminobutyrate hydrolase family protein [Eubacteriales bacterium]